MRGDDLLVRVEAGAVVDEFELRGIGPVVARYTRTRTSDGAGQWHCTFTVAAAGTGDLALVHRLSASSLTDARRCVRHAVEFLAGRAAAPAPTRAGGSAPPRVSPLVDSPLPGLPATDSSATDSSATDSPSRVPLNRGRREADRAPRIPVFDLPSGFDVVGPPDPFDRRTPSPLS
jgi:hypothetical protein